MFASILNVIAFKQKSRYDYPCDQYTRLFMPKLFFAASIIMTWNYFNDQITCAISNDVKISPDFIHSTCWINGFFIYKEMHERTKYSHFYGIPQDIDRDGLTKDGHLCSMKDRRGDGNPNCHTRMSKRYFLHYQWLPFYICSLSVLYYIPYIFYKMVNKDIISLVNNIRAQQHGDKIARNYFNYRVNSKVKIHFIVTMNFFVKVGYVATNLIGFFLTNAILEGRYYDYGYRWLQWNILPNKIAYDMKERDFPKPGNYLLPPVGICELLAAIRDNRGTHVNDHKFVCEISQNVMYQYILLVVWYFLTAGIIISITSFVHLFSTYVRAVFWMHNPSNCRETMHGKIQSLLTLREIEYLDIIKTTNMALYGDVLRELTKARPDLFALTKYFDNESSYMARRV